MAGTGHPYEIVNYEEVIKFVTRREKILCSPESIAWLKSKKVIKFYTSEKFTDRVKPASFDTLMDTCSPRDADHLRQKLEKGDELRLFSDFKATNFGPDLSHIVDWLLVLERSDRKRLSKLYKMTVEQVSEMASRWTSWTSSQVERGEETVIERLENGMFWVEMLDEKSLAAEGTALKHCIGGYGKNLVSGGWRMFSLRGPGNNSIVSLAIMKRHGIWTYQEARTFSNAPVPVHCEQALVDLLNKLDVVGNGHVHGSNLVHDKDAGWQRMVNAYEEIQWQGHTCYQHGRSLIVMSNFAQGVYLAEIHFSDKNRVKSDGSADQVNTNIDPEASVRISHPRHFHIEELRDLSKVINALGNNDVIHLGGLTVTRDGVVAPLMDTYEMRNIGDVECVVCTGYQGKYELLVTHSRDKNRILARIGGVTRDYAFTKNYEGLVEKDLDLSAVKIIDADRLNITETRRLLSVMNELNTVLYLFHDKSIKDSYEAWENKYLPRLNHKNLKWLLLAVDGVREDVTSKTWPGSHWLYVDGHAELRKPENSLAVTIRMRNSNEVYSIGGDGFKSYEYHKDEIVDFLNKRRWVAGPDFYWNGYSPFDKLEYYRQEMMGNTSSFIFQLHGVWQTATSDTEIAAAFKKKGPRKRSYSFSEGEASALLRMLPINYEAAGMDEVFSCAIVAWTKSFNSLRQALFYPRLSAEFIDGILSHFGKLTPVAQKKLISFLTKYIKRKMSGTKSILLDRKIVDLILKLHPYLAESDFIKLISKISDSYYYMEDSRRKPRIEWLPVFRRADELSQKLSYNMLYSFHWMFFHLQAPVLFEKEPITLEEASAWAAFAEIDGYKCMETEAYRMEDGCKDLLTSIRKAAELDPETDWTAMIARYEGLIAYLSLAGERRAEQLRQYKEEQDRWMADWRERCSVVKKEAA